MNVREGMRRVGFAAAVLWVIGVAVASSFWIDDSRNEMQSHAIRRLAAEIAGSEESAYHVWTEHELFPQIVHPVLVPSSRPNVPLILRPLAWVRDTVNGLIDMVMGMAPRFQIGEAGDQVTLDAEIAECFDGSSVARLIRDSRTLIFKDVNEAKRAIQLVQLAGRGRWVDAGGLDSTGMECAVTRAKAKHALVWGRYRRDRFALEALFLGVALGVPFFAWAVGRTMIWIGEGFWSKGQ